MSNAFVAVDTGTVVTVAEADVEPAGIESEAGTEAAAAELVRLTVSPPAGAGLLIVIVACEGVPPATDVGERVREVIVGAVTVMVCVAFPLYDAVRVDAKFAATGTVVITNVALV